MQNFISFIAIVFFGLLCCCSPIVHAKDDYVVDKTSPMTSKISDLAIQLADFFKLSKLSRDRNITTIMSSFPESDRSRVFAMAMRTSVYLKPVQRFVTPLEKLITMALVATLSSDVSRDTSKKARRGMLLYLEKYLNEPSVDLAAPISNGYFYEVFNLGTRASLSSRYTLYDILLLCESQAPDNDLFKRSRALFEATVEKRKTVDAEVRDWLQQYASKW